MERDEKEEIDSQRDELHEYLIETKRSQSNILWEDAHRNARRVDQILWKGSDDATAIQRSGIAVFGFFFLVVGVAIVLLGTEQHSGFEYVLGGLLALLAAKLFGNALRGLGRRG